MTAQSPGRLDQLRWDYFVSHASEDKTLIAAPLAHYLRTASFETWYDSFSLNVGDSLSQTIEHGLSESKYGIVILSRPFLQKEWPRTELERLLELEREGTASLLPVWHQVGAAEISVHYPAVADRKAADTAKGLQSVAEELVKASQPEFVGKLPLNNVELTTKQHEDAARDHLRRMLDAGGSRDMTFLLLSAYPVLIARAFGYAPRLIPGFKLPGPLQCDFAFAVPQGVTGGVNVEFVKLGPTRFDPTTAQATLDSLAAELGPHRKNGHGDTTLRNFPAILGIGEAIKSGQSSPNPNWNTPEEWKIRIHMLTGRRGEMPQSLRRSLKEQYQLPVEFSSYDRLLDVKSDMWN